jgi:hypothetical protein
VDYWSNGAFLKDPKLEFKMKTKFESLEEK